MRRYFVLDWQQPPRTGVFFFHAAHRRFDTFALSSGRQDIDS